MSSSHGGHRALNVCLILPKGVRSNSLLQEVIPDGRGTALLLEPNSQRDAVVSALKRIGPKTADPPV